MTVLMAMISCMVFIDRPILIFHFNPKKARPS